MLEFQCVVILLETLYTYHFIEAHRDPVMQYY